MIKMFPIPAFNDNYIWAIWNTINSQVAIVDPGTAEPVLAALKDKQLQLSCILITHHHWDHTGGIEGLLKKHPVPVYGPANESIAPLTHRLIEKETISLAELNIGFTIVDVPGHTSGHIAYYGEQSLFCGDTLFTGGCGRLFEGTAKDMYTSLSKLASLPDDTLVYCAHEYTLSNLNFARAVEPNNNDLLNRLEQVQALRAKNEVTVPATLATEKQTNPFLRCDTDSVKQAAEQHSGKKLEDPIQVLAEIRKWKDHFVG